MAGRSHGLSMVRCVSHEHLANMTQKHRNHVGNCMGCIIIYRYSIISYYFMFLKFKIDFTIHIHVTRVNGRYMDS